MKNQFLSHFLQFQTYNLICRSNHFQFFSIPNTLLDINFDIKVIYTTNVYMKKLGCIKLNFFLYLAITSMINKTEATKTKKCGTTKNSTKSWWNVGVVRACGWPGGITTWLDSCYAPACSEIAICKLNYYYCYYYWSWWNYWYTDSITRNLINSAQPDGDQWGFFIFSGLELKTSS